MSPEAAEAGAAAGPGEAALSVEVGAFGRGQEPVALQAAFTVSACIFLPKAFSARSASVLKPGSMQHKWCQLMQDRVKHLVAKCFRIVALILLQASICSRACYGQAYAWTSGTPGVCDLGPAGVASLS